jgi:septal ring factor EnvC (AmiA/AmiB activator)
MTTGSGLSTGTGLKALLAAIQRSPIVVRFASQLSQVRDQLSQVRDQLSQVRDQLSQVRDQLSQVRDWASWQKVPWASVRRSPDVDAYVLAWIASHVRARRQPRSFI